MHLNHRYLLARCAEGAGRRSPVILDFGCGGGELVEAGRDGGLHVFGADVFYGGGSDLPTVKQKGLLGREIVEIQGGVIPFPANTFDAVVANQVFEHVEDLEEVLREIHRVLRPGGVLISLFPTRESIREGHCGIPGVHRFSRASRLRYAYLLAWRSLGFGHHKGNKPCRQWCRDFLAWLDRYTHYRCRREIHSAAGQCFERIQFREDDYMSFRVQASRLSRLAPLLRFPGMQTLVCWISIRFGSTVLFARKSVVAEKKPLAA